MEYFKKKTGLYLSFVLLFICGFQLNTYCQQTITETGYSSATYNELNDNQFLKNWLILGPIKINNPSENPNNKIQKEHFDQDFLTKVKVNPKKKLNPIHIGGASYSWSAHTVKTEDIGQPTY